MNTGQTGPRTPEGKAVVSQNAVRHGLTSRAILVNKLETEEAWEEFRTGMLRSLAPADELEQELAENVVLGFWRMRRVAREEAAAITQHNEQYKHDGWMPSHQAQENIRRYGGYLSRELYTALKELRSWQA